MDVGSLVSGLLAARMGEVQLAVAAKLVRMDADQGASVAKLVDAAQQNGQRLADAAAAGIGQAIDISV